ncbi:PREDICTED: serine-rich adhesin for platelets-like [Dufourea novaeangliae]|uniref:serine-rich adhesin for platelets-like n=1 Tax=Dufourea novaeangliae TaxID=178035 RepID=UPI000766EEB6|nr:PREDICTED: serine-rich adhesin for platelets-like [Dufourea novaeangliae]
MTRAEETSRACCVCKKLFCCVQCRERHEKKKHSDRPLNCPLCTSHKLPLQSIEDKSLLYHIVITHLPLYCYLCGEIFKHSKDLESFGTCKWWQSQHRHSLLSDQKSILGTPPLTSDGKESSINNEYNGNFDSLTSPPELYRNTSTPMVVGQKNTLDFKTPIVPNFSLKTPKTNSASLKNQTHSGFQEDSSNSKYVSFPSSTSHKETPFRSLSTNRENKGNSPTNNSGQLGIMMEQEIHTSNVHYVDNHGIEDMELTGVEGEALPDSKSSEIPEKRSESLKKVRFSDQYEPQSEPCKTRSFSVTENEEYFEACETLSEMKESLENSQIQIYAQNTMNSQKENRSPDGGSVNVNQASATSRVLMMVVVENNSTLSTSELINSGLKKLESITSGNNLSNSNHTSSACSSSVTTVDSYCSASSHDSYTTSNHAVGSVRRDSDSSNSSGSTSSGGLFYAVANAVKTVMKSFSGVGTSRNSEREQVSQRDDVTPRPSTSDTFNPMSSFAASLLRRPGKRTRDSLDSPSSSHRQMDLAVSSLESRSPLAKRHRGWYRIKAREPIARMRNSQLTSPRGVSSETQVFHQGSLSVGDTVLPLPSRAHQSTQTD